MKRSATERNRPGSSRLDDTSFWPRRVCPEIDNRRAVDHIPAPKRHVQSSPDAIAKVDNAAIEAADVKQVELQQDIVGEEPLAAANHDWGHKQVTFVDQPGSERLRGEVGAADGDITIR